MAKLKLIDTKDKFLLEIDGTEIPYVTSYQKLTLPNSRNQLRR